MKIINMRPMICTALFLILKISLIQSSDESLGSKCHSNADHHTYANGQSCCKCNPDYSGNGLQCFEKSTSIIVRGKLAGKINNIDLRDQDLHGYVHTLPEDTRNYVAFGPLPVECGAKSTLLAPLVTPIHWLFAGNTQLNALNGFDLTGGVFSRTSDATFYDEQGEVIGTLFIRQNFTGFEDATNELKLSSHIDASLPTFVSNEQVIYPDFNQIFAYRDNLENPKTKKVIESKGSLLYKLTSLNDPNEFKNYRIEYFDVIHFSVCEALNDENLALASASTKLSTKKIFASFENEKFARFTSANYIRALDDPTPNRCDEPNDCSVYAECVLDPGSDEGYYCACKAGFDGDGKECQDVNECAELANYCSPNAHCVNLLGYYECKCEAPFVGDGRQCELSNADQENVDERARNDICKRCHSNAECVYDEARSMSYCRCMQGFRGNGYDCTEHLETSSTFSTTEATTTVTMPERTKLYHTETCKLCHPNAKCEGEAGAKCCKCNEGFIGNGKYCLQKSQQVQVKGQISGLLNNEKLNDLDFYSYVLTHPSDSRNLIAIGNIPYTLGGSFQVLISLASPINWLFAGRNTNSDRSDYENASPKLFNGFMSTGGAFTRHSVLNFYDEESPNTKELRIKQEFYGYDPILNEIYVQTEISGQIPYIDMNAQVIFKDYSQEYEQLKQDLIVSSGEMAYQITSSQNPQSYTEYKIVYQDEIKFSQCPFEFDFSRATIRVDSKRVQIAYTKSDSLVKFTSANFMRSKDSDAYDPCVTNECSIYAECVLDYSVPSNYSCECKQGFEGDGQTCLDVNECENGDAVCDENAVCYNLVGHYECNCRSPFKGNGKQCHYDLDCTTCDQNAQCLENQNRLKTCVCNDGYIGDGFACKLATSNCNCGEHEQCVRNYQINRYECKCRNGFERRLGRCVPLPCNEYANCNENARCEFNTKGSYECKCVQGFHGDGYTCTTQTCDTLNNCHFNADCAIDMLTKQSRCVCRNGYVGNGYECVPDVNSCNKLRNCHVNAECLHDERTNRHFCKCKPGFSGDGYECSPINACSPQYFDMCDENAHCIDDRRSNTHICKCKPGYEGNGMRGKCYLDEVQAQYLVYAQGASIHKISLKNNGLLNEESVQPYKNRLVYKQGQTAVGIDFDCREKFIYWSDVSGNTLNRIREDGAQIQPILDNVTSAEGLAIDWISRNIYFTDSEAKTIEVVSLNGKYRKVLINVNLNNPRGIAVDPVDGYIFWTDWNRKMPKIERAYMDGTHRIVLASTDLGVPNGIYFDHKRQEVCWADAKTKRIECIRKDGSNRRVITQQPNIYPFDLAEIRSNIYWSDWTRKAIQNVDKDGLHGQTLKLAAGGNGRVYGLTVIKSSCPSGLTNACDRSNGGCAQLCLPRPDFSRVCACSDNALDECLKKH